MLDDGGVITGSVGKRKIDETPAVRCKDTGGFPKLDRAVENFIEHEEKRRETARLIRLGLWDDGFL